MRSAGLPAKSEKKLHNLQLTGPVVSLGIEHPGQPGPPLGDEGRPGGLEVAAPDVERDDVLQAPPPPPRAAWQPWLLPGELHDVAGCPIVGHPETKLHA